MPVTVTICDETTGGAAARRFTLDFPIERLTVRELIRERVYQEVQEYNRRKDGSFSGLVQPSEAEVALNGFKVRAGRDINWKTQFEKACEAFEQNRIIVLVGDTQADSLDAEVELTRGVEVTFLRLVMLVGG